MKLSDLFENLSEAESPKTHTPEQLESILLSIFAAKAAGEVQPRIAPGSLLRHRFPASSHLRSSMFPALFLGYLDEPIHPWHMMNTAHDLDCPAMARILDCRILMTQPDGITAEVLSDSAEWELVVKPSH